MQPSFVNTLVPYLSLTFSDDEMVRAGQNIDFPGRIVALVRPWLYAT